MKERSVIMNEGNRRMELLGSAPIPKALLAMGLPAMIGMMINALYNLVDAYFVGGLGTSQMGAISVAARNCSQAGSRWRVSMAAFMVSMLLCRSPGGSAPL